MAGAEALEPTAPAGKRARAAGARRLSVVVVLSGAAALAIEICASRLLAPFFGTSTVVWANIIGLILLYLSAGYWLGGRVADRHPSRRRLGAILLGAAVAITALPFVARPILSLALQAFSGVSIGEVVASFFATLLLFSVPVTLLGMVSPFAIRLAVSDVAQAGGISGRLYALSTLGSIVGTFLPALLTIPLAGTQRTMIGAAAGCAIAATILLDWRWAITVLIIGGLLLVPPGTVKEVAGLIAEAESQYQYVDIVQAPGGVRYLELNEGIAIHSVWRASSVLTGEEWDMFLVVPRLMDRPVRRVLVIGNACGTTARAYSVFYPQAHIDGVELDPTVTRLCRQYMGLGSIPNLTVITADGRPFLAETRAMYDLIVVDAYQQPYIPFQLATREFFDLCRQHLNAGGALALNMERIPGDDSLDRTIESTVAASLPDAWVWPALRLNELVLAFNDPVVRTPTFRTPLDPRIASLGPLFTAQVRRADDSETPMTDDRAPVEWLTDRALIAYITGRGTAQEPPLPTSPGGG
ncbi:MAG TPA: fused MFS/spermidine synthase [Candidatus Binatia bacterium]|nr:fused MFS/spermidine synthase [Candidatus Binatia bacterium]